MLASCPFSTSALSKHCPAAVKPWPTKTVLKFAQRVSSEKTSPLLLVSRIQLLTTRVVTIGKELWAERECNPVVSVYNDMGLETHINSICQLAFTVDFRRWANVLQVPLSCAYNKTELAWDRERGEEERKEGAPQTFINHCTDNGFRSHSHNLEKTTSILCSHMQQSHATGNMFITIQNC